MEKVFLATLGLLLLLKATAQGPEIQLSNVTVNLTRDISCCGYYSAALSLQEANRQCRCDSFCAVYGDCCLDHVLFSTDEELQTAVSAALRESNCSLGWRPSGSLTSEESLPTEGDVTAEQCPMWESEMGEAAQEYLGQLRALWGPVILQRSSSRHFAFAPGQRQWYLLLQDCGSNASTEEVEACELERPFKSIRHLHDVISLLPVTAGDGLHYKNIHCAQCHGFEPRDVVFWEIMLVCIPDDLNVTAVFRTNVSLAATSCDISRVIVPVDFPWRAAHIRVLESNRVQRCDESPVNADNVAACRAYFAPFDDYANPHCAKCNSAASGDLETNFTHSHTPGKPPNCPLCGTTSLSVLFDFSPEQGTRLSQRGQRPTFIVPDCEHGRFFDISTGRCRVFYCPAGQTLADDGKTCLSLGNQTDQCTNRSQIIGDLGFFSCDLLLQSELSQQDPRWLVLVGRIEQKLGVEITAFDIDNYSSSLFDHSIDCPLPALYSYTLVLQGSTDNTTLESLAHSVTETVAHQCWKFTDPNFVVSILDVRIRNFDERRLGDECAKKGMKIVQYTPESISRVAVGELQYLQILIENDTTLTCPSLETFRGFAKKSGRDSQTEEFLYLCRVKLDCPIYVLNSSDLSWNTHNGTELVVYGTTGRNFSADDFIEMTEGRIAVCRFPLLENTTDYKPDGAGVVVEKIVSLVGITVSEVFLLLSLLNYYVFPELRKLPGKNMISFIIALFSMQLIFILGPGSPLSQFTVASEGSCLAFAILIHYLVLAVFFWSNVISLHFVRTFGGRLRLNTAESRRGNRVFGLYSLYGWGAPVVMVGVSCAVHFLAEINGQRENVYGDGCLISGGIVYFFAVPASTLMCLNAAFCVRTVVGIRRTRKDASLAQRERGLLETIEMEMSLCIKIFVATGMPWIILFALGFLQIQGRSYLVIIDFTLQGPLVFLAFAFTKRVRDLWRRKLSSATTRSQYATTDRMIGKDTSSSSVGLVGDEDSKGIRFTHTELSARAQITFNNPIYAEVDADGSQ